MNNSYQAQIIQGKGKHICINRNREENCNQILDVKSFFLAMLLTHNHNLYKLSLTRPYSFCLSHSE